MIAGPFEPTQSVTLADLQQRWRAGAIAASDETAAALASVLGPRGGGPRLARGEREPVARGWAIVPAHELSPRWSAIAVDGVHPLVGAGALALPLCGDGARGNIDAAQLTTVVMSGTTALTGRTAKRIDDTGVADTVRHIAPFFRSADVVHVSNEVAFVRGCRPETGQERTELKFCARDRYIELLEALGTRVVELTGSHLTDYGTRALARTIEMYRARGWAWYGGGRTQIEATAPGIVEDHGNRLAFVGCNAVNWWVKMISPGLGTANCDWARMALQIRELRAAGYLPIATVQHRELRTHAPAPDLVRDLRGLAEAGALYVMGSQAHVAHPWDVHFGAYVHYGPGNILFAQYREEQREASVDKLYIHAGVLLSVDHLYVRTEHGQPRLLDATERAAFLAELAAADAAIAPAQPHAVPVAAAATRERPDSLVVDGRAQRVRIVVPAGFVPDVASASGAAEREAVRPRYPLVVDLDGSAGERADAFVVRRVGATPVANGDAIVRYMRARYSHDIDPRAIRVTADPAWPKVSLRKQKRHRH